MPARHRIVTVILLSSTLAAASPDHAPPPDDKAPAKLLAMRTELRQLAHDDAVKQLRRFRALCDADGYPLVGNLATKGDGDRMQPSQACQLIRERPASRSW